MNKRSDTLPDVQEAKLPAHPLVLHERTTATGQLVSRLFFSDDGLYLQDGDGELYDVAPGDALLVIHLPYEKRAWLEKLIDSAELMVHHSWGRRPMEEKTITPHDIRTAGRQSKDDIPF